MTLYKTYKDSGIEWIGSIPSHWEVKKIKHRCYVKARVGWKGLKSDEFLQEGYAYLVTGSDFKNDKVNWKECYHIDKERYDEDPYIQLQDEDLLITKDGTIGKLAIVNNLDKPACLNSGIFVVRSTKDDFSTEFLFWVLKSKMFTQFNEYTSYGSTIQHLYQNVFVEFGYTFPSKEEQTAIASYLDSKTAEIDALITDKNHLLQLYEEEKAAVINQAVTKGISPKVKMKDSGIEWLGEIPEHWEAVNLKWVSKIYSGGTPSKNNEDYWQNGTIPWLNSGTVNQFYISEPSEFITEEALKNSSAKWIPEDSLVIALAGQGKTKGMAAQVMFKATCNQSMGVIVPNDLIENRFLLYYLVRNYQNIRNLGGGDKRDGINLEMVGGISIPLLPIKEQQAIVRHIESEYALIDAKIVKTQKLMELLTEYRTALISEVVTGKIKVIN
ncbi:MULTISPECIES: restriction endonuclease subunit S [unclassified Sphingobacterium]|uniref:restriction endonuclease subunit S n=1 Tax=unclassified Sphingobacterium TaxID=2609468 RepID=UPI0025FBE2F2|nr:MULTISPECIES: restriction endonuclease subunit S [unclassified Sphingobacterium]